MSDKIKEIMNAAYARGMIIPEPERVDVLKERAELLGVLYIPQTTKKVIDNQPEKVEHFKRSGCESEYKRCP